MILVLTGTTYAFNALVAAVDAIAPTLGERVVVQTGVSTVVPQHCGYFAFAPDLHRYIAEASLVISHGGAGSSYEILGLGKRLVSVENTAVNDSHQWDLLQRLDDDGYIVWCRDLGTLAACIAAARTRTFTPYAPPPCTIHLEIIRFLETTARGSMLTAPSGGAGGPKGPLPAAP